MAETLSYYTILPGDTLSIIAGKVLGSTGRYREFTKWNPWITAPDTQTIYPGDKIAYPVSGAGAASTPGVANAPIPVTSSGNSASPSLIMKILTNKYYIVGVVLAVVGIAAWKMGYLKSFGLAANPRRAPKKSARKGKRAGKRKGKRRGSL